MAESARVRSVNALEEFRGSWLNFGHKSLAALDLIWAEIRKTEAWLQTQVDMWAFEIRKGEEAVFLAKQELAKRKMMRFADRIPDTSEQEKAVRKAVARLEFAREKLAVTRRWLRDLDNELIEFEGPVRSLKNLLEGDVPRAGALLKSKIEALEAYLAILPPEAKESTS